MVHGAAHELIHWIAALVLVVGGAIFVALAVSSALVRSVFGRIRTSANMPAVAGRPAINPRPTASTGRSSSIVAGLSLGAAAIHLAAAPHHYAELGDLGAGFVGRRVFQAAWARAALRATTRRTAWIGIVVNLAIVAAWVVSRSVGLPVGTGTLAPESIGLPDRRVDDLRAPHRRRVRRFACSGVDRAQIARRTPGPIACGGRRSPGARARPAHDITGRGRDRGRSGPWPGPRLACRHGDHAMTGR